MFVCASTVACMSVSLCARLSRDVRDVGWRPEMRGELAVGTAAMGSAFIYHG